MADRDRGIGACCALHQQQGHGLADDVAPATDNHVGTLRVMAVPKQQLLDPSRGPGHEISPSLDQLAHVEWVQAVNVFPWV